MLTWMERAVIQHGMGGLKIAALLRSMRACDQHPWERLAGASLGSDLAPAHGIDGAAGQLHRRHPRPIAVQWPTYRDQLES